MKVEIETLMEDFDSATTLDKRLLYEQAITTMMDQARLLGASGERDMRLRGEIDRLKKENRNLQCCANCVFWDIDDGRCLHEKNTREPTASFEWCGYWHGR